MNVRGEIIMNLSPKQYPNLNKYFNKTPKGFILFFLIMYALSAVGTFLALFGGRKVKSLYFCIKNTIFKTITLFYHGT